MKFYYFMVFTITAISQHNCDWKLVFNDEFDNNSIDSQKWEVVNEDKYCTG